MVLRLLILIPDIRGSDTTDLQCVSQVAHAAMNAKLEITVVGDELTAVSQGITRHWPMFLFSATPMKICLGYIFFYYLLFQTRERL